ncbi:MAG: hypothetical protein M5U08_22575 [Burkholderiales bacterium]|nr:hypothetical protein [Burkholderiales bacterium]
MDLPTEPIGSIPRPTELMDALQALGAGRITEPEFSAVAARAVADTVRRFEATGSPVITDGEQTKPSFATYPIHGLTALAHRRAHLPGRRPRLHPQCGRGLR